MTKNIHLGTSLQQCCSNQNKHCKILYIIIGCTLGFFLLWLIALSIIKSRKGPPGQRGPPGLRGQEGQRGPMGVNNNEEMKNEKVFYITKDTDFSTSTEVKPRSGFILGNGVNSNVTITLPHFSVIGNGATFHIFNQSPVFNFTIKAPKINGQNPAQMSFTSGGTSIKMLPRQFLTIVIMAQQYVVFNKEVPNKKPILHWMNSWENCGGIPKKYQSFPSDEGFIVGPSLQTWGCQNYKKGMDVVKINSTVKNANTLGKNPTNVPSGGIFVVENLNRTPITSKGGIVIKSDKPVNINTQAGLANRRSSSIFLNPKRKQMSAIQLQKQRDRLKNKKLKEQNKIKKIKRRRRRRRRQRSNLSKRKKEEKERKKKAQEELKRKQMMRGNSKSKKKSSSSSSSSNNDAVRNLANAITFSRLMRRR